MGVRHPRPPRRWALWSRGSGDVWHETALAVHNIGEFESPSFHLAVSPAFTMRDDAVTLHYADLQTPMSSRGQRSRSPPLLGRSFDIAALAPDEDQLAPQPGRRETQPTHDGHPQPAAGQVARGAGRRGQHAARLPHEDQQAHPADPRASDITCARLRRGAPGASSDITRFCRNECVPTFWPAR